MREYAFDGLVGPTHNYAGLSPGNLASDQNRGRPSNPRQAALQGLAKMRFVAGLGVGQAVLPPHLRPSLRALRQLGFAGSDEAVLAQAWQADDRLVRLCSSAAAMWTANAATVAPSTDTLDGRLHVVPANLSAMFHRALEAPTTRRVLARIFDDPDRFAVHPPLPAGEAFADEGAANHLRLWVPGRRAVHLFGWGRSSRLDEGGPVRHPARQTLQASQAVARLNQLRPEQCLFARQSPASIDGGAFHSDVLAVANEGLLLVHEGAFSDLPGLLDTLRARLGEGFLAVVATEKELPVAEAVAAYPFNSQLVTLPDGGMALVAPAECSQSPRARAFLERVVATTPVTAVHHLDLRQSMNNGGGPACLRLRIWMDDREVAAVRAAGARVLLDDVLAGQLEDWVQRHYRDRLTGADLADPALLREVMTALDELTGLLGLGAIYDFQV